MKIVQNIKKFKTGMLFLKTPLIVELSFKAKTTLNSNITASIVKPVNIIASQSLPELL